MSGAILDAALAIEAAIRPCVDQAHESVDELYDWAVNREDEAGPERDRALADASMNIHIQLREVVGRLRSVLRRASEREARAAIEPPPTNVVDLEARRLER